MASTNIAKHDNWVDRIHERTREDDQRPDENNYLFADNDPIPRCIKGAQEQFKIFCDAVFDACSAEISKQRDTDIVRIEAAMKYWWGEGVTLTRLLECFNSCSEKLPYPDDDDDDGWGDFAAHVHTARKGLQEQGFYFQ